MTVSTTPARTGPYRGLVPFEEADEPYFFGRERECAAIFDRLFASRLTIVYGESGVGKSSILRAGVIKRIKEHELSVPVLVTDWSGTPTAGIDRALDGFVDRQPGESLEGRLRRTVSTKQQYVMVILDQFEELLRGPGRAGSAAMHDLLDAIADLCTVDGGVSFVVALRADALADVDGLLRRLEDEFAPETYRVEPMTEDDAERAIREPVNRYNEEHGTALRVEDELVADVLRGVADAGTAPAMRLALGVTEDTDLPFLQIVMSRIWDAERSTSPPSDALRASTMRELGGTETIMGEHVQRILGSLAVADQRTAALVLERLITPTGGKVAYSAEDLAALTEVDVQEVQHVLDELSGGDSRLLGVAAGSSGSVYELYHDRLIGPVANWREARRSAEIHRQRVAYRRRVIGVAAVAAGTFSLLGGVILAAVLSDSGPPQANVQSMMIPGDEFAELDVSMLHDGDVNEALTIPVDQTHQFKIQVNFADVTEIVDIQVVPSEDELAGPEPDEAYIAETRYRGACRRRDDDRARRVREN